MKKALVLAGGGTRGIYQLGVLKALHGRRSVISVLPSRNMHSQKDTQLSENWADTVSALNSMYGDPEKLENAKQNKHMMMREAAEIAKEADVRELWFTHYSPSLYEPLIYEAEMMEVFEHTVVARDGQREDISFKDEGE